MGICFYTRDTDFFNIFDVCSVQKMIGYIQNIGSDRIDLL